MECVRKLTNDLYWVGADDRRLELFENIHPIPRGVSYNSYLLLDEKTVLFDTADWSVCRQFLDNIEGVLKGRPLDFMVVNHVEPDHAASLQEVLLRHPETVVVSTEQAFTLLHQFGYKVEKQDIVKEGDTRTFGKHTIAFVEAPMVHWPEVMVSFDTKDGVLFSADAFGSFGALGGRIFNDEVNFDRDWLDDARRYYTNIVGKYGPHVLDLLGKAKALKLDIKMIAPLHGPVWRSNLGYILDKYVHWASYEPEEKGVLLVYASMYGNTESTASILAAKLAEKGMTNIAMYDVSKTNVSYLISDAFKYSHIVLASVTYNLGIYPKMLNFLEDMKALNVQKRIVGIIENGSWACTVGGLMQDFLENQMKAMTVLQDGVTINSSMTAGQNRSMDDLVSALVNSINGKE
ncbi:FprA family A-type flavoprotein [Acidaminococcus sp. NSJ-142]|jgi:flavorubredoxin|uniref:FprA family A-type flavoprotein n=1 Tax=Acidaminococcus TaxID=904 RepID=UPI000CF9EAB8|nr:MULTISPECIES: FprA family A-type flavoprotein [Acidaminococcus]MCD2435801.1 FprA family A-type flavoprotein [Acidaminococcus hominis]MCH4097350.1 FprA family A-type flavoprotein [Acidaminococcus provencensis]RHK01240.1 FprA family A-type flavoprotein [Acidaminococcus sp. AM05-11]